MKNKSGNYKDEVCGKINTYLQNNFPQIRMHGGNASIQEVNLDEKYVSIKLSGACSGCGISPMTIDALETRLPDAIPEIENVRAWTGQEQS